MLFKTFYFTTPIFVEPLPVIGRLPEYFQNFIKWLSSSNKSLKSYWFERVIKINKMQTGGFLQTRHRLPPVETELRLLAHSRESPSHPLAWPSYSTTGG